MSVSTTEPEERQDAWSACRFALQTAITALEAENQPGSAAWIRACLPVADEDDALDAAGAAASAAEAAWEAEWHGAAAAADCADRALSALVKAADDAEVLKYVAEGAGAALYAGVKDLGTALASIGAPVWRVTGAPPEEGDLVASLAWWARALATAQ